MCCKNIPTPPLGGEGWSLGPGAPRSTRSTQRECHKVPVLVCTPGSSTALSPPCPPQGCAARTPLGSGGRREWGWGCCTCLGSPNPPSSQLSGTPRAGTRGRSCSSVPCWEGSRRRRRRGGGCPGQAGTGGLCRGGTGWQKDPENLQANTGCRSITVIVAAQGCTV